MTTSLKWESEPAGHFVARNFHKDYPESYFRIWPDYRGYHAKCVNPGSESDMLGIFRTREEAMQRCHEFITPKRPCHGGMAYYEASPRDSKPWPKPEKKNPRIRLLFES